MSVREREHGELPSPHLSLSDRKVGQGLIVLKTSVTLDSSARPHGPLGNEQPPGRNRVTSGVSKSARCLARHFEDEDKGVRMV